MGQCPVHTVKCRSQKASASGLYTSSKDHRGQASLGRESPLSAANGELFLTTVPVQGPTLIEWGLGMNESIDRADGGVITQRSSRGPAARLWAGPIALVVAVAAVALGIHFHSSGTGPAAP